MRSRFLSVPFLVVMLAPTLLAAACTGRRSPEAPSTGNPGTSAAQPGQGQPGQGQTPDQTGQGLHPGLLTVSKVDVLILESFPPQIVTKVEGWLPDGCSEVGDITQQRNGFTIDVTITIRRLSTGACIAIAPQVSRNIRLNGSFAESGAYTVRVNGVEKAFTL
jgi:inhibitor of cysteine peptidase